MSRLRFAVIGSTGMIGKVHAEAINRLDNAALVAVMARSAGPVQAQAATLGVKAYTSLDALLADPKVDAVTVATPHPSHLDIILKAVQAGKHVLTDKPMGVSVSEADRMVEAAREAGVTLGVIYQNRFRPECQKAKQMLDAGLLGDLYRTHTVHATIRTQAYYDSTNWRGRWNGEGGGILLNQSIHSLDLLQWLGGMPAVVVATANALRHSIEVEDFASALLEYEGGGQGTVHCNTVQAPNDVRLELYGDLGSLTITEGSLVWHKLERPIEEFMATPDARTSVRLPYHTETHTFERPANVIAPAVQDFANSVLAGKPPAVSGEEGRRSLELSNAIMLSAHTGERVRLPLDRAAYDDFLEGVRQAYRPR